MAAPEPSLAAFAGYFLRLGTVEFGGPIALVGYMQRDLVEERRWVRKDEYVKGLVLAQRRRARLPEPSSSSRAAPSSTFRRF